MPVSRFRSVVLTGAVVAWLGLVGVGLWLFDRESFTPAPAGSPSAQWPEETRLIHATRPGEHTLVLVLHPECPCSRATVEELGNILAATGPRLQTRVLMVQYSELARRNALAGTPG